LVTRQPKWQNYFRGLKAAAEEDAQLSSSAFETPLMSRTDGQSHALLSGRRKAIKPSSPPLAFATTEAGACEKSRDAAANLLRFARGRRFATILADPPWQFTNKTGKVAPEHKRLARYGTMKLDEIIALPIADIAATPAHLYLWCPNAMLPEGLAVMRAWGFTSPIQQ
jgi:hypothetical protein